MANEAQDQHGKIKNVLKFLIWR